MKIKCVSIDLVLANPTANCLAIENEINKAVNEGVDVLAFGGEVIEGSDLGNINKNETLVNLSKKVLKEVEAFVDNLDSDLIVCLNHKGKDLILGRNNLNSESIACYYGISTLDNLEADYNLYNKMKKKAQNSKDYVIMCANGVGESSTDGSHTSLKMIFKDGNLVSMSHAKELVYDSNNIEQPLDESRLFPILNKTDYGVDYNKMPYLPQYLTPDEICEKIIDLQANGLYQRMKSMNRYKIIVDISGGIDSTVGLLSCIEAFKKYNLPLTDIIGITMPGLGTTERTYKNAKSLLALSGITQKDIDIREVLRLTDKNLELADDDFGLTFQQTQSRERTQLSLDYANKENGIFIGTGCMSEFALGWMTYGGDHLSMYAISVGMPKSVVKVLAKYYLKKYENHALASTLKDVIESPVSPELAPVDESGIQHQKTESLIGDYIIQDFFIYNLMANKYGIKKIFKKAVKTFPEFTPKAIYEALKIFTLRFFTRQYKKNCFGEGVGIFDFSLSNRVSWKMAGDLSNAIWEDELKEIAKEYNL